MTTIIDCSKYDIPDYIKNGIIKILIEAAKSSHNIKNVVQSDNPEIKRFINDCTEAINIAS